MQAGSGAGGSAGLPDEGVVRTRMKRFDAAASLFLSLGLVTLTGCGNVPYQLDPFGMNVSGGPADYATSMRVGAAAHAGGDLASAVSVYRRAASVNTAAPAPFVAAGNALLEMGEFNEAIVSFNSALARDEHDREALRGLARGYLMTGRPAMAGQPLAVGYRDNPDDPKLLQLVGVADDFVGRHEEAQARYRRGLELAPRDPALSLNLALSLALSGNYAEAIGVLRPIASAAAASPRERQTLALIYGLQGDRRAAEQLARLDLDPVSVQHNLAYYDSLRRLSPAARHRAIQSLATQPKSGQPS